MDIKFSLSDLEKGLAKETWGIDFVEVKIVLNEMEHRVEVEIKPENSFLNLVVKPKWIYLQVSFDGNMLVASHTELYNFLKNVNRTVNIMNKKINMLIQEVTKLIKK